MKLKRIIPIILIGSIVASLLIPCPLLVAADGGIEQYNLTVAEAYKSFVVILDDSVGVFSSPTKKITSTDIPLAISAEGFIVSYSQTASSDGPFDADDITGGYVMLTSTDDADIVYLPITSRATLNDTDFNSMSVGVGDANHVRYSDSGAPLGGKAVSSPTFTIMGTPQSVSKLTAASLVKYNVSEPTVWTYEFNIYADGGAVPLIALRWAEDNGAYMGLKWLEDGSFSAYSGAQNTSHVFAESVERGIWHRVAITYTGAADGVRSNGRLYLYIDGVYCGSMYNYGCQYVDTNLCFAVSTLSSDGKVSYDDLKAYAGVYRPADYTSTLSSLSLLAADDEIEIKNGQYITYDGYSLKSLSSLLSHITGGDYNLRAYTDNTFSKQISSALTENGVIVVSDLTDSLYKYYYLSPTILKLESFEQTPTSDSAACDLTVKVRYDGETPLNAMMIIKAVDDSNTLRNIYCSEQKKILGEVSFSIDNFEVADYRLEAMFLDNLQSLVPYRTKVILYYGDYENTQIPNDKTIGSRVLQNADFEYVCTLSNQHKQNSIEQYTDSDGNTSMRFQRLNSADFHLDATEVLSKESDCVVYELDFKLLDLNSCFDINLLAVGTNLMTVANVQKNGILSYGGISVNLSADRWYRLSVMIDYYDRIAVYYIDGEEKTRIFLPADFALTSNAYIFRTHVPASYIDLESDRIDFLVDNIRAYEGMAPRDEIEDPERVVVLSDESVFSDTEDELAEMVNGYISVHKRSGVVYYDGEQTILENKPYDIGNTTMVNADELDAILGKDSGLADDVTIEDYAEAIGLCVSEDTEAIGSGMLVLGEDEFIFPDNTLALQNLNDFLMYYRPSPDEISADYKSSALYGVHPRIQASQEDFERIKELYDNNSYIKRWVDHIISVANAGLNDDAVIYELRDGVRLQYVSREVLEKMYIYGLAYQFTGDIKYVTRAYKDLEAVCAIFPDWHPSHHIDTGMMAAAVAIGYDWMYHGFTPEQRKVIEKGVYSNCFYHVNLSYQTTYSPLGNTAMNGGNHNVITNGGFAMAAMAMLDVYPEIAEYIISNAVHGMGYMYYGFGKDGAWQEGPNYWELTMQYTAKAFSSLQKLFGTCYTLDTAQGLPMTAQFMLSMQTKNGIYSYSDSVRGEMFVPEFFWLADKYDVEGAASAIMALSKGNFNNSEDYVLAALWYDPSTQSGDISIARDNLFSYTGVGNMRSSWDDTSTFFGFKAGKNNIGHGHLDAASFIFESMGVRWAQDNGGADYNQPYYFEEFDGGKRWLIEGLRTKDHNCIEINPDDGQGQMYVSDSPVTRFETDDNGGIVVVDSSDAYRHKAESVKRGFFFTDDRQSLVIRDEVVLTEESDICWYLITPASVTVSSEGTILSSGGKELRLEFATDAAESSIEYESAPALGSGWNRIIINVRGSLDCSITVKLTPASLDGSPIESYHKDISLWDLNN